MAQTPPPKIKICGLSTADDIAAANQLQIDMVGFNFYPESPRYVALEQAAYLAAACAPSIVRVVLLVDPEDKDIEAALAACNPHYIQLHGSESPARCAQIKSRYPAALIKALPIASRADVARTQDYDAHCSGFLFDSPPTPKDKGGTGTAFDWTHLKDFTSPKLWALAGGLTPDNVAEACALLHPPIVDVSSGVERERGKKDVRLMADFVEAARNQA